MKKLLNLFAIFTLLLVLGACSLFEDVDKSNTPSESVSSNNTNYTSITVDFTKAKTQFSGNDSFSYDGIIVYGVEENNNKTKINSSKYSVELQYKNAKVTKFSEEGTYKVAISYVQSTKSMFQTINNTLGCSYDVTYSKTSTNVTPSEEIKTPTPEITPSKTPEIVEITYDSISMDHGKTIYLVEGETLSIKPYLLLGEEKTNLEIKDYTISIKNMLDMSVITTINEPGSYFITIDYIGSLKVKTKEFKTIITVEKYLSDKVTELLINSFVESGTTSPDFDNIKIYSKSEKETKLLNNSDVTIEITYNNVVVTEFKDYGEYKIKFTYEGVSVTKTYTYLDPNPTKSLKVSGLLDSYKTKPDLSSLTVTKVGTIADSVLESNEYSYKIYYNNTEVTDFTTFGTYKVIFSYMKLTEEITINYLGPDLESISIQDLKTTYNELPDFSNLIVKAKYEDSEEEKEYTDYNITIYNSNSKVISEITNNGNYSIEIRSNTYTKVYYRYTITVSISLMKDVLVSYSYKNETFEDKTISLDMYNLKINSISVPDNYYLCGFTNDFTYTSLYDNNYALTAIILPKTNICIAAYTNENYKYISHKYFVSENELTYPDTLFPVNGELNETISYNRILPCYSVEVLDYYDYNTAEYYAKDGLLKLSIYDGKFDEIMYSSINLYKDGESYSKIKSFETSLINTTAGSYYLEGNMVFKNNGKYYLLKVTKEVSEFEYLDTYNTSTLLDLKNPANFISESFSEGVSFKCDYLLDNCPNGYELSYFIIYDEEGNEVKTVDYLDETIIYFTDLNPKTRYKICPYYSKIQTNVKNRKIEKSDVLGCYVWCQTYSLNPNICKVEVYYGDDRIYCYYVEKGSKIQCFMEFRLPIRYNEYKMLGSFEKVDEVTEDMKVNAELVLISDWNNKNIVVYYDHYFSYLRNIIKIDYVDEGGSATAPKMEDRTLNGYLYKFTGWNSELTNITCSKEVYASYTCENDKLYDYTPRITFYNKLAYLNFPFTMLYTTNDYITKDALISKRISIVDSDDNKVSYIENYDKKQIEFEAKEGKTYSVTYRILYDYGNGVKEINDSKTFTIPSDYQTKFTFNITEITEQDATIDCNSVNFLNVQIIKKEKFTVFYYESYYSISKYNQKIYNLAENTEYILFVGEKITSNDITITYFKDSYTIKTKPIENEPEIRLIKYYYVSSKVANSYKYYLYINFAGKNLRKYTMSFQMSYRNPDKSEYTDFHLSFNEYNYNTYYEKDYDNITLYASHEDHYMSFITYTYIQLYYCDKIFYNYILMNYMYVGDKDNLYICYDDISYDVTKAYLPIYKGELYDSHFDINKLAIPYEHYIKGTNIVTNYIDSSKVSYKLYYTDSIDNFNYCTVNNYLEKTIEVSDFDKTGYYICVYTYEGTTNIGKMVYTAKIND